MTTERDPADLARRTDDILIAGLPVWVLEFIDFAASHGFHGDRILAAIAVMVPDTPGGRAVLRGAEVYLERAASPREE